jgi:hypothetical protein
LAATSHSLPALFELAVPTRRTLLERESLRLRAECLIGAERHFAAETKWYVSGYALGAIAPVIAAAGGTTALATERLRVFGGIVTLFGALVGALQASFAPTAKSAAHHSQAKAFEALFRKTAYFVATRLSNPANSDDQVELELAELVNAYTALVSDEPVTGGRAYRKARLRLLARHPEARATVDEAVHAHDLFQHTLIAKTRSQLKPSAPAV